MKITKRTANAIKKGMMLRKFTYSDIAAICDGISREAVRQWMDRQSIPDKYVERVQTFTGIKINEIRKN